MSNIPSDVLRTAVQEILAGAKGPDGKPKRKFLETVELQIGLKNYDPSRDKRFSGTVKLPYACKPNAKVGIFGDAKTIDQANAGGFEVFSVDDLKKFERKKKVVKNFAKGYSAFLASSTLIRKVPALLGPTLNKMGMFPTPLTPTDDIGEKISDIQRTIKFQLKKVLCLGVAVGHVNLDEDELIINITMAINFLVSLLKKQWQNVKSLHIKSTMGKVHRIY